jgi:hypothetical protein
MLRPIMFGRVVGSTGILACVAFSALEQKPQTRVVRATFSHNLSIWTEYSCLVRIKTSVTLPRELLDSIDRADPNRSAFTERAVRAYVGHLQKLAREKRDKHIIEANSDRLNREAVDVLRYQSLA